MFMNETLIVGLVFLVLVALELRLQLNSIRAVAIVLALLLLAFSQPSYRRAARHALDLPASARVLPSPVGPVGAEYASDVLTMEPEAEADAQRDLGPPLLGILVLTWFACTSLYRPRLSRKPQSASSAQSRSMGVSPVLAVDAVEHRQTRQRQDHGKRARKNCRVAGGVRYRHGAARRVGRSRTRARPRQSLCRSGSREQSASCSCR